MKCKLLSVPVLIALAVAVAVLTPTCNAKQKGRQLDGEDGGFLVALTRPFLSLIQSSTRQIVNQVKKIVTSADNQGNAVRSKVQEVASDIGRNALGDIIENMRIFRGRVQRLQNVVRNAQRSVQSLLDNDDVSLPVKVLISPLTLGLATLDGQVSGLKVIVNAGSGTAVLPEGSVDQLTGVDED